MKKHEHYWSFDHTIWEGRTKNEVAVHRYCACGKHQIAYARIWHMPRKVYQFGKHGL